LSSFFIVTPFCRLEWCTLHANRKPLFFRVLLELGGCTECAQLLLGATLTRAGWQGLEFSGERQAEDSTPEPHALRRLGDTQ